jgi:hypothetical protein
MACIALAAREAEPAYINISSTSSQFEGMAEGYFNLASYPKDCAEPWSVHVLPPPGLEEASCSPITNKSTSVDAHALERSSAWAWINNPYFMMHPDFAYGGLGSQQPAASAYLWPSAGPNVYNPASNPCRRPKQPKQRNRRCQLLLGKILNELEDEDPNCIVFARKIQRLGFNSDEILRKHYEQYGEVRKVLLSNAHEYSQCAENTSSLGVRMRPSGLALILMADPKAAANIFAAGSFQRVQGVDVQVRPFERRSSKEEDGISEDDADVKTSFSFCSDSTRSPSDHSKSRCDSGSTHSSDSDP